MYLIKFTYLTFFYLFTTKKCIFYLFLVSHLNKNLSNNKKRRNPQQHKSQLFLNNLSHVKRFLKKCVVKLKQTNAHKYKKKFKRLLGNCYRLDHNNSALLATTTPSILIIIVLIIIAVAVVVGGIITCIFIGSLIMLRAKINKIRALTLMLLESCRRRRCRHFRTRKYGNLSWSTQKKDVYAFKMMKQYLKMLTK